MANIKFSEFTEAAAIGDIAFVVGYDGSTNKRILATDLLGNYLPLAGGTMTGNTLHGDNVKSVYGAGGDLQIYHSGSASIIKDAGVGNLQLNASSFVLNNSADDANMIIAVDGGSVSLFHNASKKFETTSAGISVTGNGIFSGNVGIGTTTPDALLDIRRSDASGKVAEFHNNVGYGIDIDVESDGGVNTIASATNQSLAFVTNGGSNERMRINKDGNVGIGTTNPNVKLHVAGNIHAYDNGGVNAELAASTAAGSTTVAIRSSGITHFNGGNVGIGTTTPGAKLQIGSATHAPNANLANNLLQIKSPSGFAYLTIGNGDTANATSYIGGASGLTVIGSVTDAGALSEYMRITNTGRVGIGTTSPNSKLGVNGNIDIQGGDGSFLTFNNGDANIVINNNGSGRDLSFKTYSGSSSAERMRINKDGNVGIGTTTPADKLSVVSTVGILGDGTNHGLLKLYCEAGTAHHVGIKGPNHSGGSSYTLQLPNALPNVANQILESNATGTLSWIATPSGGGGGASSLNDLSDVALTTFTSALINVPAGGLGSYSFTMGAGAGNSMTTGAQSNTFIGYNAGNANNGDNHVMIGAHAGERNAANRGIW